LSSQWPTIVATPSTTTTTNNNNNSTTATTTTTTITTTTTTIAAVAASTAATAAADNIDSVQSSNYFKVPTKQCKGLLFNYHEHKNNTTKHTYRKIVKPAVSC
jgi:hypothetical protein